MKDHISGFAAYYISGAAVCLVLLIVIPFRYEIIPANNNGAIAIKLDCWTGKTWVLRGQTWVAVENNP